MKTVEVLPGLDIHRLILRYIFHHGQATRQELSRDSGRTLMTVSKAVTSMLDDGILLVDGTVSAASGRRSSVLKLNPRHKTCICVDIGYSSIKLALVAFNGDIEKKIVLPSFADPMREGIPEEALFRTIQALIEDVSAEKILGIAVAISGMVQYEEGRVLFCPNILGFNDRMLAREISERFDLPVLLDTSARCMALGEYCYGAGFGIRNQMTLSLGVGSIAGGIISDGKLFRGAEGYAGEIGHTCVRPSARVNRCSCGGYDCLELYATLEMLCGEIQRALDSFEGYSPAKNILNEKMVSMDNLHALWLSGDPIVQEHIEQSIIDISTVLAGAVNLLTPSVVILSGGLVWHLPEMVERIENLVRSSCLMPLRAKLRIVRSELGEDAVLKGAAALLIRRYFGEQQ